MRGLLIAVMLLSATPALAQETLLRLSETAERSVRADQLVAVLRAQATGGSASAVQQQVNRQVAAALEKARAVSGVTVATGSYWTGRTGERRDQWQSSQEIRLSAIEAAPALLELSGELQAQGLTINRLSYEVSRQLDRSSREDVTTEALGALRERAERLAGALGMSFVSFREVRVDAGRYAPPPTPRMMASPMAASAAPPPPPSAEPADVPISATVEGDALLRPR